MKSELNNATKQVIKKCQNSTTTNSNAKNIKPQLTAKIKTKDQKMDKMMSL